MFLGICHRVRCVRGRKVCNDVIQGNGSSICDPWQAEQFREKLGVFDARNCNCLSLCSETRYNAELTSTSFRFAAMCNNTFKCLHFLFRRCDSRNLNLSPLCDLFRTGFPAGWKSWVRDIYEKYGEVPAYLDDVEGTERNYYSTKYLRDGEIISSLTQVMLYI